MEKLLNIEKLKKSKKFVYYHDESKQIVTSAFVKKLRIDLKMSQSVFASVLGVTKKTIEKWEQGKNPVSGPAAKLLFLVQKRPEII